MDIEKKNPNYFQETIDTQVAEQNFVDILKEKKTIFLNGTWGSGKTTFIEKVVHRAKKINVKVITIDLWRSSNNVSIFSKAFYKLERVKFLISRFIIILLISCFIVMTGVVKVPFIMGLISKYSLTYSILFNLIIVFVIILSVGVAVSKYLDLKLDRIDYLMLTMFPIKNKVLVIDDFDRLTLDQQKDAYKLFTLLKEKIPIVFLGDHQRLISQSDSRFLLKIIDQRVELPFVLHPAKIWSVYFNFLEKNLETQISDEFKKLFIVEQRNLRDRYQYNNYVYQEFYENGKKGRVQVEEQLLLIYLYLFDEQIYRKLLSSSQVEFERDSDDNEIKDLLVNQVNKMIKQQDETYPLHFSKNNEMYFIYESVQNASLDELYEDLNNESIREQQFDDSYLKTQNDFTSFVTSHYSEFTPEICQVLLEQALISFKRNGKNSPLTYFILREHSNKIMPFKVVAGNGIFEIPKERVGKSEEEIKNIYFEKWSILLDQKQFDFYEKINFFRYNYLFSYIELTERYGKTDNILNEINNFEYPEEMLLLYLTSKKKWYKFQSWEPIIWQIIENFSDNALINFLKKQNVLSETGERHYEVSYKTLSVDNFPETQDNTAIITRLSERLHQIESNKYLLDFVQKDRDV